MIRRPPRSTQSRSSAASDVYKRQGVGNTGNTPAEVLEVSFPVTVLEYALNPDGGGAGRFRGGTSVRRRIRLDHDATVTFTSDRAVVPPYGLFGGLASPPARFWLELPDGSRRTVDSKTAGLEL